MTKSVSQRRELVLRYLQARVNTWIDGPELANEKVGGSEGLRRVREIRKGDPDNGIPPRTIKIRPHPDRGRDVFQYMLVEDRLHPVIQEQLAAQAPGVEGREHPVPAPEPPPQTVSPGVAGRPFLMRRTDDGMFELTKEVCVECGGPYDNDLEHRSSDARHLNWMKAQEATGQQTVDVPGQPPPYRFKQMPTRIELGKVIICPRCQNKRRLGRTFYSRKKMEVITTPDEEFTRDPYKPTINGEPNPCIRCGGFGLVPQYVDDENEVTPLRQGEQG